MKILPHRYPFLLVDRVLDVEPGKRVTAIKNVSANEPFFQGHWPGRPIMPGVLILEAIAQAAGLMMSDFVDPARRVTVIAAIDDVKLRRPVVPGDQLRLEVCCLRLKTSSAHVKGVAWVGEQVAAEARIKFVMFDADRTAA
jgi:beta-hydroxyacyl-ACP dehydratase FabZ